MLPANSRAAGLLPLPPPHTHRPRPLQPFGEARGHPPTRSCEQDLGAEADARVGTGSRVRLIRGKTAALGRGLGGNLEEGVNRGGRELVGWGRRAMLATDA